jgi:hypothetical protein
MLSLDLKRAALRKRNLELSDDEVSSHAREAIATDVLVKPAGRLEKNYLTRGQQGLGLTI